MEGASGSAVVTDDLEVLGTYSFVYPGWNKGGATPLRNMEVRDEKGKLVFPAYDFMEGVEGQNGSYKEQIQKYFLRNGQQTSLSKLRG